MKRLAATLACLVMVGVSGLALAQSTGMDGDFWVSQSRSDKSKYLDGFSDGMELGHYLSVWKNLDDVSKADAVSAAREAYSEYLYRFFGSVTGGQLLDGLDKFYADVQNRRIKISGAAWIVVNQIAGTPEVDEMILNFRRNAK